MSIWVLSRQDSSLTILVAATALVAAACDDDTDQSTGTEIDAADSLPTVEIEMVDIAFEPDAAQADHEREMREAEDAGDDGMDAEHSERGEHDEDDVVLVTLTRIRYVPRDLRATTTLSQVAIPLDRWSPHIPTNGLVDLVGRFTVGTGRRAPLLTGAASPAGRTESAPTRAIRDLRP